MQWVIKFFASCLTILPVNRVIDTFSPVVHGECGPQRAWSASNTDSADNHSVDGQSSCWSSGFSQSQDVLIRRCSSVITKCGWNISCIGTLHTLPTFCNN